MTPMVSWFDSSSIRCWSTAGTSLAVVVFLSLFSAYSGLYRRERNSAVARRINHPLLFIVAIALMVTICRWWTVLWPQEVNPDETQMIAQAMRYLQDGPIPWRTVDGGTSGPLESYILAIPVLLGFPLNFAAARFVGLFCVIGTLSFTYLTLRALFSDAVAKIAVIPMLMFFALARLASYVHYSTELLPILLLAGALYFLVRYTAPGTETGSFLFLSGLMLGAAPFAKLQAGPVSAVLVLGCTLSLVIKKRECPHLPFSRHMLALFGGVLAVPAILISMVLWGGAVEDFWLSYVVSGLHYAEAQYPLRYVLGTFLGEWGFRHFIGVTFVAIMPCVVSGMIFAVPQKRFLAYLMPFILYTMATVYVVLKPARTSFHYLLFLIPPVALTAGSVLGSVVAHLAEQRRRGLSLALLVFFLVFAAGLELPGICGTIRDPGSREEISLDTAVIVPFITSIARPGDRMTVWGWKPKYFVLTGLVPGTREVYTAYQIMDTPLRNYYRRRFLKDLKAARPAVFVDAVASAGWGYTDRKKYGHETFKELADFIRESYTLIGEYGIGPGDAVRVYILTAPSDISSRCPAEHTA